MWYFALQDLTHKHLSQTLLNGPFLLLDETIAETLEATL